MKENYVKCLLYTYPNALELIEQIDLVVEKKALGSMDDFRPCLEQCETILDLTEQKKTLIKIRIESKKILNGLSPYELDCLDYKYFKKKPKEYYDGFDASSRQYFREQNKLIVKLQKAFNESGLTDKWFTESCLKSSFFKEMLKRVNEQDYFWKNRCVGRGKTLKIKRVKNEKEIVENRQTA